MGLVTRIASTVAICSAFGMALAITPAKAEVQCNSVGGSCVFKGYWNIYVSLPGGNAWADDYVGNDPATMVLNNKAMAMIRQISICGIRGQMVNSSWVAGFQPDYLIVISGPYTSPAEASGDLSAARRCSITAYSKFGILNLPGAE